MNITILIGRLTKDPETRYAGDTAVTRFTVAVDRNYKKEGEQQADFPSIVCFGKTAEFTEKYFHKGMKVGITGRLQTGSYTNKDGVKVYTTEIIADRVEFCESKQASNTNNADNDGFMEIPDGLDDEGLPFN